MVHFYEIKDHRSSLQGTHGVFSSIAVQGFRDGYETVKASSAVVRRLNSNEIPVQLSPTQESPRACLSHWVHAGGQVGEKSQQR